MATTTMNMKYFDTLEYVRKAKELRDPEALAEYQVKQIETAIETAVSHIHAENKKLATKGDLNHLEHKLELKIDLKIANLRDDLTKFILKTAASITLVILSGFGTVIGMFAHEYHWF